MKLMSLCLALNAYILIPTTSSKYFSLLANNFLRHLTLECVETSWFVNQRNGRHPGSFTKTAGKFKELRGTIFPGLKYQGNQFVIMVCFTQLALAVYLFIAIPKKCSNKIQATSMAYCFSVDGIFFTARNRPTMDLHGDHMTIATVTAATVLVNKLNPQRIGHGMIRLYTPTCVRRPPFHNIHVFLKPCAQLLNFWHVKKPIHTHNNLKDVERHIYVYKMYIYIYIYIYI